MKKLTINPQTLKALLMLSFILLILIVPSIAQGDDFDNPGAGDVPIDGGLSLLVAAGVGYGIKKVKEKRKNDVIS